MQYFFCKYGHLQTPSYFDVQFQAFVVKYQAIIATCLGYIYQLFVSLSQSAHKAETNN